MSTAPLRVPPPVTQRAVAGTPEAGRAVWDWRGRTGRIAALDARRRRRQRRSALVALVVPSLLAWWFARPWLAGIAAVFVPMHLWLGTVASGSARERAERIVGRFGELVGAVVGFLVLAPLFYGVVTPIGLFRRALGTDALRRRREPSRASYWEPRTRTPSPRRPF